MYTLPNAKTPKTPILDHTTYTLEHKPRDTYQGNISDWFATTAEMPQLATKDCTISAKFLYFLQPWSHTVA